MEPQKQNILSYLKGPFSPGIFSPGVGGHKRPFGKAISRIIIVWPANTECENLDEKRSSSAITDLLERIMDLVPMGDLRNNSKSPRLFDKKKIVFAMNILTELFEITLLSSQ